MISTWLPTLIGAPFEKPSTHDFIWPCWTSLKIGGVTICYNLIAFLLTITFVVFILLFVAAFARAEVVPKRRFFGKLQLSMEAGIEFVRNQILLQMIGPEGMGWLPYLCTLFFFIFIGNILEVVPFVGFPLNSRLAFPLVMALTTWVIYNAVGVKRHGFFGYLKIVLFPPGAPKVLYVLLTPIEFFSVIVLRPITLTIRLFANMVAGHFLLAVFFLGSLALVTGVPYVLGIVSFGVGVALVGFEIFVASLQAFIFSMLTASYIAGAMAEEH
jgi:F-type H+-transporting ATPase subunit a